MADIFLSYATPNRDFVDKIRSCLEERGKYTTWMDHHKILPGDDWGNEIESNLRNCKVFIVTVSEESSKSSWVKRECLLAENLGKPRIPILYKSGQNNGLPFSLMDLQYIDFTENTQLPSFNSCIRLLLEVLKQHISNPSGGSAGAGGGSNKIRPTDTTRTPITAVPITALTSGKPYWGPLPTSQAKMAPPPLHYHTLDECQPSRQSLGGDNNRRHPNHHHHHQQQQQQQVATTTTTNHHNHHVVTVTATDRLQTKVYPDLVSSSCQLLSRSELAMKEKKLTQEISIENMKPVQKRNFEKLEHLQTLLDGLLARKQNEYPNINELQRQFDELIFQIELASTSKDYSKAKLLQNDLNKLESTIQRVKSDDIEATTTAASAILNPNDVEVLKTRASLEAKLMQLNEDYNTTFNSYDFTKAQNIVDEMNYLKKLRKEKPSRADYALQAKQLIVELQSAKFTQNLMAAKTIHKRLELVQSKELTEKEAEIALGIRVRQDGSVEIVSPPPPSQLARQQEGVIQPTTKIGQYTGTASALATKENSNSQVPPSDREYVAASRGGDDFALTRDDEKAAMGSRLLQHQQQSLEDKPGAIAIDGPRSSSSSSSCGIIMEGDEHEHTMTEESSRQQQENVVTEASLVESIPIDMEQQILDVLQRNAVQAVAVEKMDDEPTITSPVHEKKSIVSRFRFKKGRRWGFKKKNLNQSNIVDEFFGFDR